MFGWFASKQALLGVWLGVAETAPTETAIKNAKPKAKACKLAEKVGSGTLPLPQ